MIEGKLACGFQAGLCAGARAIGNKIQQVFFVALAIAVMSFASSGVAYAQAVIDADADGFPVGLDCDDSNPLVNPAAPEVPDGIDNDCDGLVDAADPSFIGPPQNLTLYLDADQDGFGIASNWILAPAPISGYSLTAGDCDDSNADVNPGAAEVADGIDNDCDGDIDEGVLTTYYQDLDEDNYGNPNVTQDAATQPVGYVTDNNDCDDTDDTVNPGATEVEDGVDNDCDGIIDEGFAPFRKIEVTASIDPNPLPLPATNVPVTLSVTIRNFGNQPETLTSLVFGDYLNLIGDPDSTCTGATITPGTTYSCSYLDFITTNTEPFSVVVGVTAATTDGTTDTGSFTWYLGNTDITPPTVAITSTVTDPTNTSPIPVTVTFSEEVENFIQTDMVVNGGSVSNFSTSDNTVWTFDLTPSGDGTVTVDIAANVAADLAGNNNTAASQFSVEYDATPPGLTISGVPETYLPGDTFNVTFTFAEDVTGFDASDVDVTGGSVGAVSGGPRVYTATVTPGDTDNVTVSVAEGAAVDAAGNLSVAASASSLIDSATVAGEMIADFTETRARNLVQNQPGLARFLSAGANGYLNADVTRGNADISFATGGDSSFWLALEASRTDLSGSGDQTYALATLGGHMKLNEGLLIGGMLQFDRSEFDPDGATGDISGDGWMAGPYMVAQLGDQPLFFEGRLLYGESDNEVNPLGTFTDSFKTERFLGMLALEGNYEANGMTLYPRIEYNHVSDRQLEYIDGLSNTVPEQKVTLSELSVGVDLEAPIKGARHEQAMTMGLSGIWSKTNGSGAAVNFIDEDEGGRARIDVGYVIATDEGLRASAKAYVDGLGNDDYNTYGVALNLSLNF
ncbi:Ig-like domain-containing protein [Actibacterium pelagium]|nr:Ig-like domain-containing protein [Actibacterium pelagium]